MFLLFDLTTKGTNHTKDRKRSRNGKTERAEEAVREGETGKGMKYLFLGGGFFFRVVRVFRG